MHSKGTLDQGPPLSDLSDRDAARLCQEALLRNARLLNATMANRDEQALRDLKAMTHTARFRVPAEYHYQRGVIAFSENLPTDAAFHFRQAREKLGGMPEEHKAEWYSALSRKIARHTERLREAKSLNQESRLEAEISGLQSWNKPNLYDEKHETATSLQHKAGVSQ